MTTSYTCKHDRCGECSGRLRITNMMTLDVTREDCECSCHNGGQNP